LTRLSFLCYNSHSTLNNPICEINRTQFHKKGSFRLRVSRGINMKFPLIIENNVLIKYDAPTNGNDEVIVIPDGVTEIAKWAFARCFDVKEIIIPDTVEIIGERAFFDCRLLKKVVLPSRLKAIGNETFCLCHSLEDTVIPEGVESIGPEAFYECKNLKKITLPKTLKYIGMRAFFSAYIDTVVFTGTKEEWETIDKGFEWRGRSSFDICFAGERAPLDPEKISEDFVIENGVLVNYTGSDSNITVPEGITAIGDHVFSNSGSLYSVTLPDSIKNIGKFVFYRCPALSYVNIPAGVTQIGPMAFLFPSKDLRIVFGGTKEQWKIIDKNYRALRKLDYCVECTDGILRKPEQ